MRICLFTKDPTLKEFLTIELLVFGVTVFFRNDLDLMFQTLVEKQVDSLILDIDESDQDWIKVIKKIKSNSLMENISIILMTSENNLVFLKNYISEGISGIFDKRQSYFSYIKKIRSILNCINEDQHKRKYVRVKPLSGEHVPVSLKISSEDVSRNISGKIKDLSVYAASILIDAKDFSRYSEQEIRSQRVSLIIDGKEIKCEGTIIRAEANIAVVAFKNGTQDFKSQIAHFIYDKIQH